MFQMTAAQLYFRKTGDPGMDRDFPRDGRRDIDIVRREDAMYTRYKFVHLQFLELHVLRLCSRVTVVGMTQATQE